MTKISRNDVLHLAQLASLQLGDNEAEALSGEIENIIRYVESLSELDTSGVEPTYQVTDLENNYRDDVVAKSSVNREDLLALAPTTHDNQVKVPKVL